MHLRIRPCNAARGVTVFSPRRATSQGRRARVSFAQVDPALQLSEPRRERGGLPAEGTDDASESGPLPRAFAAGVDEKLPGLIVLLRPARSVPACPEPGQPLNLTGFTKQKTNETWDTWIVEPGARRNVRSALRVGVAADKNRTRLRGTCDRADSNQTAHQRR